MIGILKSTHRLVLMNFNYFKIKKHQITSKKTCIVLIHGFFNNHGVFANLISEIKKQNYSYVAINLSPPWANIEHFAQTTIKTLLELQQNPDIEEIFLIGHSMGGLVIRKALSLIDNSKINAAFSIATPHLGTKMASIGIGACAKQMHYNCPWIKQLPKPDILFFTISAEHDLIVIPNSSASPDWATENYQIYNTGHNDVLYTKEMPQIILNKINSLLNK